MIIAVMALQGAFLEHEQMLRQLGADTFEIRKPGDWQRPADGLVLPGGESTAQLKLLEDMGMLEPVRRAVRDGLPVFGTCAGLILLAKCVENETGDRLATMDIEVCRNAYGRQLGSFRVYGTMGGVDGVIPMTFIRAPYIKSVGEGVDVLAEVDGRIVAAREANQLVTSFHPELDDNTGVHDYFLDIVRHNATIRA